MKEDRNSQVLNSHKPGIIGRTGRILFGGLVGWYTILFIRGWIDAIRQSGLSFDQTIYTGVVQKGNLVFYLLTFFSLYFFPWAIVVVD